jgi:hypothetical protein
LPREIAWLGGIESGTLPSCIAQSTNPSDLPCRPRKLYELYMTPALHAGFTGGGKVTISPKPGSRFSAFGGLLGGRMILAVPGKLVVQYWRGTHWKKSDPDSILVLHFVKDGKGGRIDLSHVNVPAHDHAGVARGWRKYYWVPLRKYLKSGRTRAAGM